MKRQPITSKIIKSVGYDAENKILEVEFNKNTIYEYYDVPALYFDAMLGSASKGSYFGQYIKGSFKFERTYPSKA